MKTILAILGLIPQLIKIIVAVEEAFPQSGVGPEKLGLIKTILAETYSLASDLWAPIEKVVNAVVLFANKIGAFKKDTPAVE
jgi:hypothetical protein